MNRRSFVASGSAILFGAFGLSQAQRPAIGLNFELSNFSDKDPENIDILVVDFNKLEITPQYLDESQSMTIKVDLEVDDYGTYESNLDDVTVTNGENQQLSGDIEPIVVEGIDEDIKISGSITVNIEHPDIKDSYSRQFSINSGEIPESGVSRWAFEQDVTDSWGSNDGTRYGGGFTSSSAVGNYAYSFNGSDYVRFDNPYEGFPKTLCAWINTTDSDGYPAIIRDDYHTQDSYSGISLQYNGSSWSLQIGDGGSRASTNRRSHKSATDVSDGKWHLLVATADGIDDVDIYLWRR
jgi:hypothetical protein